MSWRNGIIIVLVGLGWFLTPSSVATAQERVALIIGNGAYQHVPALPNPVNDANDLAASFERLGFTIYRVNDGTYEQMRLSLVRLAEHVAHVEMIVVFFAGHGMEINGENWLIPVDAEVKSDLAIEHESISLQSILPLVSSASRLGLVILDACRNNPFSAIAHDPRLQFGSVNPAGAIRSTADRDAPASQCCVRRKAPFWSLLG